MHPKGTVMSDLCSLCQTEGVTADQLAFAINRDPSAAAKKDGWGDLPLHWLCRRQRASAETLAVVIQANVAAAAEKDGHGNFPLYHLCNNKNMTAGLMV